MRIEEYAVKSGKGALSSVSDSVGCLSVRRQEHPEVTADDEESRKEDRI